jgi:hypothetical protein
VQGTGHGGARNSRAVGKGIAPCSRAARRLVHAILDLLHHRDVLNPCLGEHHSALGAERFNEACSVGGAPLRETLPLCELLGL